MARREVLEVVCDRCSRTETQAKEEVSPVNTAEFKGVMGKDTIEYADLCRRCRSAVTNYFDKIRKFDEVKDTELAPKKTTAKTAKLN